MFHRNSFLPQLPIKILFSTLSLHSVLKLVLMIYSTWSRWSSSINGKLPGASMRNSARGKGHEEGGSAYAKVGSSLRRPPVSEHLPPKPQSAYFTALCSHLYLWLYGGLSPTTSLCKGVNLGLQLVNLLGVFQSKNSSDGSLACLTGLSGHMWLFTASQPWEAWDALNFLKSDSFEKLENY